MTVVARPFSRVDIFCSSQLQTLRAKMNEIEVRYCVKTALHWLANENGNRDTEKGKTNGPEDPKFSDETEMVLRLSKYVRLVQ